MKAGSWVWSDLVHPSMADTLTRSCADGGPYCSRSFIEVDCIAKSCIQGNFERLHVALTLINDFGYFCDFPVDLRLITFQAFHGTVMWKVKEGLANLVAF